VTETDNDKSSGPSSTVSNNTACQRASERSQIHTWFSHEEDGVVRCMSAEADTHFDGSTELVVEGVPDDERIGLSLALTHGCPFLTFGANPRTWRTI
jgi:hypothetical protein